MCTRAVCVFVCVRARTRSIMASLIALYLCLCVCVCVCVYVCVFVWSKTQESQQKFHHYKKYEANVHKSIQRLV